MNPVLLTTMFYQKSSTTSMMAHRNRLIIPNNETALIELRTIQLNYHFLRNGVSFPSLRLTCLIFLIIFDKSLDESTNPSIDFIHSKDTSEIAMALEVVYWYTLKDNASGKWIVSEDDNLVVDANVSSDKFSFIFASYDSHGRNYYIYSHTAQKFLSAKGPNSPVTCVDAADPNISTFYTVDWSPGAWVALGQPDANSTISWNVSNDAIVVSESGDAMIVDFEASSDGID
jgi:hypothetical protein